MSGREGRHVTRSRNSWPSRAREATRHVINMGENLRRKFSLSKSPRPANFYTTVPARDAFDNVLDQQAVNEMTETFMSTNIADGSSNIPRGGRMKRTRIRDRDHDDSSAIHELPEDPPFGYAEPELFE